MMGISPTICHRRLRFTVVSYIMAHSIGFVTNDHSCQASLSCKTAGSVTTPLQSSQQTERAITRTEIAANLYARKKARGAKKCLQRGAVAGPSTTILCHDEF